MDNRYATPNTHKPELQRDDKSSDTLRYEFSKGYLPMENPKNIDGEMTEIK